MVAFLRLALRRVAMMPVMILGIALLVFVVLQFSPADPAYNALGESASPEARKPSRRPTGSTTRCRSATSTSSANCSTSTSG